MSSMFDTFETDPELEKNGVWTDYGDYRIKIAYAGNANKAFTRRTEAVFKPYARQIKDNTMDRDLLNRLARKVAAETLVKGWQVADKDDDGVIRTDEDGETIWVTGMHAKDDDGSIIVVPPTAENIEKTFRMLPHLYDDVQTVAGEIAAFRSEIQKDIAGN